MRICFCVDTMDSGGAERVASILCNEFVKLNHEVDLIMISEKEKKSFYKLDKRIALIPLLSLLSKKRVSFLDKTRTLKRFFKANHYDAVISFLPNVNVCVYLALKHIKNVIHIASERNNPFVDPKSRIRRFFKELSFKKANSVVFQTQDAKQYFDNILNCPTKIIKNPVLPVISNVSLSTKTNGTIISVGRLEEQKNFQLLINAFSVFCKNHPSASLKIYGEGSLKSELEKLISELNLVNKVKLCGNSTKWIEDNCDCSLFINSSLYEGMPNSLLEALINGMPCVASDCPIGGSRELLSNNNGLLFSNNNKDDLLAKMNFLYKNEEIIEEYRKANLKMRDNYSPRTIALQWIEFIEDLINEVK